MKPAGKVVLSIPALKKKLVQLQKHKKVIVFTNGCFDLFHLGHLQLFERAKKAGDILVVGVNSDASVKKIKGPTRPILPEKARVKILSAIKYIDFITIFHETTPEKIISTLKPDVLVKGADWPRNKIIGRDIVKKVIRVPLAKGWSTTALIKKMKTINKNS